MLTPHRNVIVSLTSVLVFWLVIYAWSVVELWSYFKWFALVVGAWMTAATGFCLVCAIVLILLSWWILKNLIDRNRK